MPKVSQALAPELFDVMMMNGNLRFVLGSDPVGVTARDGAEYVAIRTAVTEQPGCPREVVQLEFQKSSASRASARTGPTRCCAASASTSCRKNRRDGDRLVVSPLLETRQPGPVRRRRPAQPRLRRDDRLRRAPVDVRTPAAPRQHQGGAARRRAAGGGRQAATRRQAGHPGRDGARDRLAPAAPAVRRRRAAAAPRRPRRAHPQARRVRAACRRCWPTARRPTSSRCPAKGVTTIGRQGATVAFPQDSMLSDQHAAISHGPAGLELRDLGSSARGVSEDPGGARRHRGAAGTHREGRAPVAR